MTLAHASVPTTPEDRILREEQGDPPAGSIWFALLDDSSLDRAYRLAGFLLGSSSDAEDAAQEALTRAWRQRRAVQDADATQAWFDRILVNVCRDRLRRGRTIRWLPLADDTTSYEDPFARALAKDTALRALAKLNTDRRIVVVLRFWADLTLEAIGERLGVPTGTVKSRLHYALRDLKRAIEQDEADP